MITFESFEPALYNHNFNGQPFTDIALSLFRFQAKNNVLYRQYIQHLAIDAENIHAIEQIPFLPISFFKSNDIRTGQWNANYYFTSSGTTYNTASRHQVYSLEAYLVNARRCFENFFGNLAHYHFLALLPSYLERQGSSLVAMLDHFIRQDFHSGFYLHNAEKLLEDIDRLRALKRKKIVVWGVSFALLDLAEKYNADLSDCLIIETGGMKGRRREITRQELHNALKRGLNAEVIYSEYGMTELLSQAYTQGESAFFCPPTMKILAREVTDPFQKGIIGETGGLNIIDLANIRSIAFIETEDLGKVYSDGSFEVLGRMDNTDVRGCNLMV